MKCRNTIATTFKHCSLRALAAFIAATESGKWRGKSVALFGVFRAVLKGKRVLFLLYARKVGLSAATYGTKCEKAAPQVVSH